MPATYTENGNTPNGSQLEFTYTFPILQPEDVKVSLNGVVQASQCQQPILKMEIHLMVVN